MKKTIRTICPRRSSSIEMASVDPPCSRRFSTRSLARCPRQSKPRRKATIQRFFTFLWTRKSTLGSSKSKAPEQLCWILRPELLSTPTLLSLLRKELNNSTSTWSHTLHRSPLHAQSTTSLRRTIANCQSRQLRNSRTRCATTTSTLAVQSKFQPQWCMLTKWQTTATTLESTRMSSWKTISTTFEKLNKSRSDNDTVRKFETQNPQINSNRLDCCGLCFNVSLAISTWYIKLYTT